MMLILLLSQKRKKTMSMYDKIKKQNGEKFAKTIRDYDNGIFDIPNIENIVKHAGNDAEPLMNYLISLKNIKIKEVKEIVFFGDLLKKAGYEYLIADTKEKQNSIKKFYRPNEIICTIGSDRYKHYHVIHVWKTNAEKIKPLPNPTREDEYGTSVMSIQISKKGGFISIKNRYNHTVSNPDNTLNSNPDNIIDGLSASLKDYFKVDFSSQKAAIDGSYMIYDKRIINYNYEINGVFIGENCYIKNGKLVEIDKNTQLIIDYIVLDIPSKKVIKIVDNIEDCFPELFQEEIKNKKIIITNNKNYIEKADEFAIIKL